jgi:OOP family OmpA-OmpF porin
MSLLSLLLSSAAWAAGDAAVAGQAPDANVQTFRPSVDSLSFIRLTDTAVGPAGSWSWRATQSYAQDLLVWTDFLGVSTPIVANLIQADLAATYSFGRARVGVGAPVVLRSFGGSSPDVTGLGDLTLDGKLRLLEGEVGLSASARAFLPTSTVGAPLAGSLGGEAELGLDRRVGARWLVAGAAGLIVRDSQDYENVAWGNQAHLGLGAAYTAGPALVLTAELDALVVIESADRPDGRPMEALLGAHVGLDRLTLRPAVGVGLGDAPGVPAARFVLAVVSKPAADRDGDGVLDAVDACAGAPEDVDAYRDEDGCPEPTDLTVDVVDSDGQPVAGATWSGGGRSGAAGETAAFDAGPARFTAGAVAVDAVVPPGPPTTLRITLPAPRGALAVSVVDEEGQPITVAAWSAAGPTAVEARAPGTASLRPGSYTLQATAAGFTPAAGAAVVELDGTTTAVLTLRRARAAVQADRIDIKDSVYFETNKAVILPQSYALLDEVAALLAQHPELLRVRVEGHTDSRGAAADNERLSQARAEAVVAYLVKGGVAAARLDAVGFGESKPLVRELDEQGRARNRRVDFFVVERAAPQP